MSTSGALPIQTPVSPNGKYVVTANTLTGTISIIDTDTDELVKVLPCSAGCHGVNFGAKDGGGYYAYVSSKFSNDLLIVDPDKNNDGNPSDAEIVGRVILVEDSGHHGQRLHFGDSLRRHGRPGSITRPQCLQRLGSEPSRFLERPVNKGAKASIPVP